VGVDEHGGKHVLGLRVGGGPLTAACLIGELGDTARFRSAGAIASYVSVAPAARRVLGTGQLGGGELSSL
jgi:hypothetical protein